MKKYFRDLLATLKSIDSQLKELKETSESTNKHALRLSECVRKDHHSHGDRSSISTKHWND